MVYVGCNYLSLPLVPVLAHKSTFDPLCKTGVELKHLSAHFACINNEQLYEQNASIEMLSVNKVLFTLYWKRPTLNAFLCTGFPWQRVSKAVSVSISWRHYVWVQNLTHVLFPRSLTCYVALPCSICHVLSTVDPIRYKISPRIDCYNFDCPMLMTRCRKVNFSM